jgi:hypothetical protein
MSRLNKLLIAALGAVSLLLPATADAAVFALNQTVNGYNYKATAEFSFSGGQWTVVLTNLGGAVSQNGRVLTGLFWDGPGSGGYTPVSANPTAGSGLFNDNGTAFVGEGLAQHSAYTSNQNGRENGIIMAGFDLTATVFQSGGSNPVLNGVDYGLVSTFAGGGISGNQNPFVRSSATFVLGGAIDGTISNVLFQYGSDLCEEPSFPGIPQGGSTQSTPEPTSLAIWALGIAAVGFGARRRMRKQK